MGHRLSFKGHVPTLLIASHCDSNVEASYNDYELENSLYRHPVVVDAAVIGVPDERLGERACAVLVLEQDEHLTLDDVKEFLLDEGISKHFLPERLELIDALPKTSTGKVRKVELRQWFTQRE